MDFSRLLLGLFFSIHASQVYSQTCFGAKKRGDSNLNDPPFNGDNNNVLPASPAVQAIIPTYKFNCNCVNITSWETYVQPGGGMHRRNRLYDITFQVWRPSPTVTSSNGYEGCYSLVGENVFTSISFSSGGTVQLSPTPPSIITAQSGDVVGYYTNSRNGNDEGIQLETDDEYNVNIVWYNSPNLDLYNLVSIGTNGLLPSSTSAAPMLKLSTSTIRCSPSSSVINCATSSSIKDFQSSLITSSISSPVQFSSVASSVSSTFDSLSTPAFYSSSPADTNAAITFPLSDVSSEPTIVQGASSIFPSSYSSRIITSSLSMPLLSSTRVISEAPTKSSSASSSFAPSITPAVSEPTDSSSGTTLSLSPSPPPVATKPSGDRFSLSISPSATVDTSESVIRTSSITSLSLLSSSATLFASEPPTRGSSSPSLPLSSTPFASEPPTGGSSSTILSFSPSATLDESEKPTSSKSGSIFSSVAPSSTPAVLGPNNEGSTSSSLIVTIVVIVVLLFIITALVVFTSVVLLKRKSFRKSNNLDLLNPNYDNWAGTSGVHGQMKPTKPPLSSAVYYSKAADTVYESLDDDNKVQWLPSHHCEPLEYSYPEHTLPVELQNRSSSNNTAPLVEEPEPLYHDVGPDASSQSANARLYTPGHDQNSCRNISEEDTVKSKAKVEESKTGFENVGIYVLSEEDRNKHGRTYNLQNLPQRQKGQGFFVDDPEYWEPATTTSDLYSQLANKKYREIPRHQLRIRNIIGSGQFGEVCKATWSINLNELELAVKTLKQGASEEDKVKFLQEAAIMGQFNHINVIKIHGVITLGEPVLICLELLENGDLRQYLLNLSPTGSVFEDFMEAHGTFLKFAREVAAGMAYLSGKSFVHRDLAARNILLNKYLTCKVADFGMARDLMDDAYYTSSGGKIPVKWTAPEAILYQKYSTASDVWSYGMVLFEIWSAGKKPFSNVSNSQTLELIQKGFCQAPPPGCPRSIYSLMVDCWNPSNQSRPSFSAISRDYLSKSTEGLLHWSPEDGNLSPGVGVCGAPLAEAFNLYSDLQKKYSS